MTSRERVLAAINHVQPDKIPFDLGGTGCSTAHVKIVEGLNKYYGLPDVPVTVSSPYAMTGYISDELMDKMGCDVATTYGRMAPGGVPREPVVLWKTLHGQDVYMPEAFRMTPDGNGGWYAYPQGDLSCEPSAHMPAKSPYFDAIERCDDFDEDNMNPEDNLEEFGLLSDQDIAYIAEKAKEARATGRCVVFGGANAALGEVGKIPGPTLKNPKGIRRIEDWYMAHALYPEYIEAIYDKETDIVIQNLEKLNAACGDLIDVIFLCDSDLSHQNGLLISLDQYDELYMPYHKKMNNWIHKNTNWKTIKHCCGAAAPLIPKFIESGFDCLNPVQTSARGMDAVMLKKEFGKEITFWGGGVDTQSVLPFGTPEEVRKQVLERCEIFGKDGGFVFASIHIVQGNVPLENVVAMINAVKEFNGDL